MVASFFDCSSTSKRQKKAVSNLCETAASIDTALHTQVITKIRQANLYQQNFKIQ